VVLVSLAFTAVAAGILLVPSVHAGDPVKNVIVMVPDGCSQSVVTLARWYRGGALAVDPHSRGVVGTFMSDSVITDSAAAATAFASGIKTSDGFVGVGPRPEGVLTGLEPPGPDLQYKPVATILEGAKMMGKATGLVATSRITHATPAGFGAHVQSRDLENDIMEHLVYQDLDVALGGGSRHLLPSDQGGRRTDGEDLRQVLLDRGYRYVETAAEMASVSSGRLWGMFASSHMEAEIDRAEFAPEQPSLAEMTAKAIEILSQDPDGFFLMVEGSQVDWAGHANDPIYFITDFLAFDDAFAIAVDFAAQDGNTMVIAFPDHNTGGMSIGNSSTNSSYTAVTVEQLVEPLQGMTISSYGVARMLEDDLSPANIQAKVSEYWGIELDDDAVGAVLDGMSSLGESLDYALSRVVSERYTVIGWTTHGHNGDDVPLWSYGPRKPVGMFDNTRLPKWIAGAYGFQLWAIDQLLFVRLDRHCEECTIDTTDPANPVIRDGHCSIPLNKDLLYVEDMNLEVPLPGIAVHAPSTNRTYVPLFAVALMDSFNGGATASNYQAIAERRYGELVRALGLEGQLPSSTVVLD
jgi:alkaline phosphatase